MEDLVDTLTRGNAAEVEVVLASVVVALAVYQLMPIAVGYGRVRPPFLHAWPAPRAHRAIGDALVTLIVAVALMCLAAYGWDVTIAVVTAALGPNAGHDDDGGHGRGRGGDHGRVER